MLTLYLQEQKLNDCSRAGEYSAERLKPSFAGFPVSEITALRINEHILRRKNSGSANATINRELAALRRMFTLALRYGMISSAPFIQSLKEAPPRQGFIERPQFEKLLAALPAYVQPVVEFLYLSAWRKREALTLQWSDVDLPSRVVRLRPERSKNGKGRTLPLRGRLLELIQQRWSQRHDGCAYVFHRNGRPIADIRRAWAKATQAVGLSGLLVHDLRRSGIRNLVRSGASPNVAAKISGHRTMSTFLRYDITSEEDIAQAIEAVC